MTNYVSGANGFIGKHLMERLPNAIPVPHSKIKTFFNPEFTQYPKVDRMFFLSTYGNMHDHDDKWETFKANAFDLLSVLRQKPDWLLYTSSSSVTLSFQTTYSLAKQTAEKILESYPEVACVVRLYSVTGVGEQPQHLIPMLIRSCMTGAAMEFVPDATHDFIDVEDVVADMLHLSDKNAVGLYELGNGFPVTNAEVKEIVEDVCQRKAHVFPVYQMREYDSKYWFCPKPFMTDRPRKSLVQSVKEMVAAYGND